MVKPLSDLLLRLFRVPPKPRPPSGTRESVKIFRASRRFYLYRLALWGLKQIGAVAGLFAFLTFDPLSHAGELPGFLDEVVKRVEILGFARTFLGVGEEGAGVRLLLVAELVGLSLLLLQLPFTYTMVRLDYEQRWYIVTDRSLRIRYGVARIREMTMTFANIQNLSIEQGPLQRLLGIADLRVRSAGGGASEQGGDHGDESSSGGDSMHVGYFRGVDNAGEIRDVIIERLKRLQDAGLGDPDESSGTGSRQASRPSGSGPDDVKDSGAAARRLVEEARALRRLVESGRST